MKKSEITEILDKISKQYEVDIEQVFLNSFTFSVLNQYLQNNYKL